MLTREKCIEIARNKCIEMFGNDFVENNKAGFCSARYFDEYNSTLEYSLMYDGTDIHDGPLLSIGGNTPFDYYASVIVDMNTGEVWKDPNEDKTKLPS